VASTTFATGNNATVKLWAKKLWREALSQTYVSRFMGTGSDNVIQISEDLSKNSGDRVRTTLRMLLSGDGISGDSTLEGNEEALITYTDDVLVDQLRHAVRSAGKMTDQRISFSIREEARQGLTDWWSDRMDTWFFNQVGGVVYNWGGDTRKTGNNAIAAPTANHHFNANGRNIEAIAGGTLVTEGSVGSASGSNKFYLEHIDQLITQAKTITPLIRPIRQQGDEFYVLFLHPHQVQDLRREATANTITWYDTQKARVQGGEMSNGIFTGALGTYNGVVLHESNRVPTGASGSATVAKVKRALFCGAQAAQAAFGQGFSTGRMSWTEEVFDYGNSLGVSAGLIGGMKKAQYNSADFGSFVLSTSWTGA
jgi:N4-gp56 family major capsid protein